MTPSGVHSKRSARDIGRIVGRVLLLAAFAALAVLAGRILLAAVRGEIAQSLAGRDVVLLALAAVFYLTGHVVRVLRLALLVGQTGVGVRMLASFHFMTSAASLLTPFKLGDIYRVLELSNLAGGFVRAIVIGWWERIFDAAAIALILALALRNGDATVGYSMLEVFMVAVLVITAVIFLVLPDNFRRLSVYIIRRSDSPRSVTVLRLLDLARSAILEAPRLVSSKVASLATLTTVIWACEATCFALVLPRFDASLDEALEALLGFLSAVIEGESLAVALGAAGDMAIDPNLFAYIVATQVPLALIGLAAGLHYIRFRFRA